ncbi:MAG: cytochrome c oxidase subunit 3 [Alphaproteobacteria bacterium]
MANNHAGNHAAHDHDFHIPAPTIWPALSCLGIGVMFFGIIALLHVHPTAVGKMLMAGGLLTALFAATQWWRATIHEARARGFADVPQVLELGNRYGIIFFIVSEVMFFAAFFAAFFYLRSYNVEWPPANITPIGLELPVINTLLLLTSGVTITWAHHALLAGDKATTKLATFLTWHLGILFLACQMYEYSHAGFGLNAGVFATVFYMLTGFHGFHVLVGTIMLMVLSTRLHRGDFSDKHHFYFEAAAWYWHFVDVVWIGLFLTLYLL